MGGGGEESKIKALREEKVVITSNDTISCVASSFHIGRVANEGRSRRTRHIQKCPSAVIDHETGRIALIKKYL